jgi:hypothetical protein
MNKKPFVLDEREKNIFYKICTALYLFTLFALSGIQLYRQFALHQPNEEWDDIAILLSLNVVVLLGCVLYFLGGFNLKKIKPAYLLAGYAGFVLIGFLFTVFKYTVLLGHVIGPAQVMDYFVTVIEVSGLLVLAWGLLAYIGSRRIEKEIDETSRG